MKAVKVVFGLSMGVISLLALIGVALGAVLLSLPDVSEISRCMTTSMYHVHLCPTGDHYVPLDRISVDVRNAVIASEDTSFYSHHGFDWYEIEQSFKSNLENKHIHRGGSTLTQQLAKNVWFGKEKSYWRKLKEAYLTFGLEKKYDKNFILEKYLNVVQFGPQIYGVKDAAQFYFKKSPADLHLLESTFLAFVLPNPDVYWRSYKDGKLTPFAHKIINIILKRMVQFKTITPDAYQLAMNEMGNFPWRNLTKADFANAKFENTASIGNETEQDASDLNKFWSDEEGTDSEPAATSRASAPVLASPAPSQAPKRVARPSEEPEDEASKQDQVDINRLPPDSESSAD